MKKDFFGIVFSPSTQPGFQSRYSGRVQDTQLGRIKPTPQKVNTSGFPKNPFELFNSRQIKEVNPNSWLRSKGFKV